MNTVKWIFQSGMMALGVILVTAGCQSMSPKAETASTPPPAMVLLPGDEVEISVFGVPDLNSNQRIRHDGKISAKLFGDIVAAGKTPAGLQDELIKLYASQIQVKAITVIARSSAAVYVTGAVGKPGKIDYLRPMTALEAIMEAGGFDQKAGARRGKVRVVRTEDNQVKSYLLDFDEIMTKGGSAPFYLKPFDTVYVPGAW
jgi:protein involved in polysaccharide export with SLBB domain